MSASDELFDFPCEFPIKVMGRDSESFRTLALTYTIRAESRAHLDRIYQDLTDSGVVLVAL